MAHQWKIINRGRAKEYEDKESIAKGIKTTGSRRKQQNSCNISQI